MLVFVSAKCSKSVVAGVDLDVYLGVDLGVDLGVGLGVNPARQIYFSRLLFSAFTFKTPRCILHVYTKRRRSERLLYFRDCGWPRQRSFPWHMQRRNAMEYATCLAIHELGECVTTLVS